MGVGLHRSAFKAQYWYFTASFVKGLYIFEPDFLIYKIISPSPLEDPLSLLVETKVRHGRRHRHSELHMEFLQLRMGTESLALLKDAINSMWITIPSDSHSFILRGQYL